jgi:uncharacterized membrane protein
MNRSQADLGITVAVAVLACAAAAVGAPVAVMIVLGIVLFAAPGYLLGQLLLGPNSIGLERVAVSTGLAFIVPIFGGLLLYVAGVPLHRAAWLGLLAGVTLVGDVALFLRRRRGGRPASFGQQREGWHLPPRRAVTFGAAVVIAVSAVALACVGVAMQHNPGYTQLWLVRPNGNSPIVNLGVGNHEGRTIRYRLVLERNGHTAAEWNLILANGQAWHRSPRYPDQYTISVNLFRLPNETHPYRHVALDGKRTP